MLVALDQSSNRRLLLASKTEIQAILFDKHGCPIPTLWSCLGQRRSLVEQALLPLKGVKPLAVAL